MDKDRSKRLSNSNERQARRGYGGGVWFLLRGEEQILQLVTARVPLPEVLNRICSALDCEIGNVVSLVTLLDDKTTNFAAIAGNAKKFGLHKYWSIGLFAENHELLGTLETYSCEPRPSSAHEWDLIERAGCLAAIAIERGERRSEGARTMARELPPVRRRVLDWPRSVN
jgi:GAF domain-containing protein